MSKKQKLVKIWWIKDENNKGGYWTDTLDPIPYELLHMQVGDKFTITIHELTMREFNKLSKASHEFEGW